MDLLKYIGNIAITVLVNDTEKLRKAGVGFSGVIVKKLTHKSPLLLLYKIVHEIFIPLRRNLIQAPFSLTS